MRPLDFLPPAAKPLSPGESGKLAPPAENNSQNEPFDDVMSRWLAPTQTGASTPAADPSGAGSDIQSSRSTLVTNLTTRQRIPTRNNAPAAATQTSAKGTIESLKTGLDQASTTHADNGTDSAKNVAKSSASSQAQPSPSPANLPGLMAHLLAPLPQPTPPVQSKVQKNGGTNTPSTPAPTTQANLAGNSIATVAANAGNSARVATANKPEPGAPSNVPANSQSTPAKGASDLVSALKPDSQQNQQAGTGESGAGKQDAKNSGSSPPPAITLDPRHFTATNKPEPAASSNTPANSESTPAKGGSELVSTLKPDSQQNQQNGTGESGAGKQDAKDSSSSPPPGITLDPRYFTAVNASAAQTAAKAGASAPPSVSTHAAIQQTAVKTADSTDGHGTSVAKMDATMKKTEKTTNLAETTGKTEKVLPGTSAPVAQENLPAAQIARVSAQNLNSTPQTAAPVSTTDTSTITAAAEVAAPQVDRAGQVERTQEIIAVHSLRMVGNQMDTVRVVIKPDANMQLSLEMKQRGSAIDAQVSVQSGDTTHLSRHWAELQQRLQQRGVHLGELANGEASTANSGNKGFQQSQNNPANPDLAESGVAAGFGSTSPVVPAPIQTQTPVRTHKGWQTWA